METSEEKHVVVIAVQESPGAPVWLKSLCLDAPPLEADVVFYYKTLCGFKDAIVQVTVQSVPADFAEGLLAVCEAQPTEFPISNVVADTEERKAEYYHYVNQLCEMERSRHRLSTERRAERRADRQDTRKRRGGHRKWVDDLLAVLRADTHQDIIQVEATETPAAWLFAPTAVVKREASGSRIVLDASVGLYWEHKLGTDLYPDFVVSRRLTTASWAFQHPSSSALLSSVVQWLNAVHASGWIDDAEATVDAVLRPFLTTGAARPGPKVHKVQEEVPTRDEGSEEEEARAKPASVLILLQRIESSMLFSKAEVGEVEPLAIPTLEKLVDYMARSFGIRKDTYANHPSVTATLHRWSLAQMGFGLKTKLLLSSWQEVWDLIMGLKSGKGNAKSKRERGVTAARVGLLVQTMDAWDLCEGAVMTDDAKQNLWTQWLSIFCDYEIGSQKGGKIPSATAEASAQAFLNRFLPRSPLTTERWLGERLAQALFARGYGSTLLSGVLHVVGARLLSTATVTVEESKPLLVATQNVVHLGTF